MKPYAALAIGLTVIACCIYPSTSQAYETCSVSDCPAISVTVTNTGTQCKATVSVKELWVTNKPVTLHWTLPAQFPPRYVFWGIGAIAFSDNPVATTPADQFYVASRTAFTINVVDQNTDKKTHTYDITVKDLTNFQNCIIDPTIVNKG